MTQTEQDGGGSGLALVRERLGKGLIDGRDDDGALRLETTPSALLEACRLLHDDPALAFDYPADLMAYDTGEQFVLWYRLHSMESGRTAILLTRIGRDRPVVASVTGVWPGMSWHERECYDLYGIEFAGHPLQADPAQMRILLPEDWEGFPFRKDYEPVFSGDPLHGPQETN